MPDLLTALERGWITCDRN